MALAIRCFAAADLDRRGVPLYVRFRPEASRGAIRLGCAGELDLAKVRAAS